MTVHPLIKNIRYRLPSLAVFLTVSLTHYLLLIRYMNFIPMEALTDALLSALLICSALYFNWYIASVMKFWGTQLFIGTAMALCCSFLSFILMYLIHLVNFDEFLDMLPFRLLFYLLLWIIALQWYKLQQVENNSGNNSLPEATIAPEDLSQKEIIDRISVKSGSRIHVITTNEIICIQACGDYVTLITAEGEYIKEQTMKYFEQHLPGNQFARIHRSTIINVSQLLRVELFGKESYQVRLKTGQTLKASITGYKLLKQKLNL